MIRTKQAMSAIVFIMLTGCVLGVGMDLTPHRSEVDQIFESATLLPDHTYYYLGSKMDPDAVIAIDNRYRLESNVWSSVAADKKLLEQWAFEARTYHGWWNCPYRGVILRTEDGQQVGVGYSRWTFSVVKRLSDKTVQVYPPTPTGACIRQERLDDL